MSGSDLERLVAAIDEADDGAIVALLAPLSERDRAALDPAVVARADELHRAGHARDVRAPAAEVRAGRARLRAAHLAWLGTGDPDGWPPDIDIHDGEDAWRRRHHLKDALASTAGHRILADRRPPWLDRVADEGLAYGHRLWDSVWRLVVDGLVARPGDRRWLEGCAEYAGRSQAEKLPDMVRRDPALLEVDLPALLDLPDGIPVLVRGDERQVRSSGPGFDTERAWSPLLAALPGGDPLRDRVLTGVLDTMAGDGGEGTATYRRFLTVMRPSVAEFADRRQRLLRLAGHHTPSVAGFAVQMLLKVDRTGRLDPADVIDQVGAATGVTAAGTARGAVKLIASALRRQPALAAPAAGALTLALCHPRPEVQQDAVRALLPHLCDPVVRAALSDAAPDLAPSVAAELNAHLPAAPAEAESGLDELLAQAAGVAGLGPVVAAIRAGEEPPPVLLEPWRDARPGDSRPVAAPIGTLDELIEWLLRVVDGTAERTSDCERALDGLAALSAVRPDDFGRRVGPLIDRVNRIFETEEPGWGESIVADFCYLVAFWMQPERVAPPAGPLAAPRDWLVGRLREVALMLRGGATARLLAPPTDENGWLDPAVLADRVIAAGDAALDRPLDAAIAVTRLAPWGRAAARERLAGLPGTLAAVVRAACGSGEDVAAAPDPVPRAVAWQLGRPHTGAPYAFGEPVPPPPPRMDRLDPEAYARAVFSPNQDGTFLLDLHRLPEYRAVEEWHEWARDARYSTAWAATQWPGDNRWVWAGEPHSRRALGWLLEPDEPLPAEALRAVLLLAADDGAEVRVLAADVLAQAVADGRLTGGVLGPALGKDLWEGTSGHRLAEALARVAAVSPLHGTVVRRALTAGEPAWRELPPRPLCALLTLLDQLCTADGCGVAD
ncbi:DUF6493 family protein, partial [Actinoplanes sp. NPDC026623]|uniref:DUF6493 family protein n=1 Tax=Actinoplanes sp. NPDC026623 TaxID=3155610 RepID=UPI0033EFBA1C